MTVQKLYDAINAFAPFRKALDWDNAGLIVGDPQQEVSRVLLSLDATVEVIREAARVGAQAVVSHHPVIFSPIRRVLAGDTAYEAARLGISVICAHTNYDMAEHGVNYALARTLELDMTDLVPFSLERTTPYYTIAVFVPQGHEEAVYAAMAAAGAGRLGDYDECAFLHPGEGRFTPSEHARPAIGTAGKREQVKEIRIQMIVPKDRLQRVISAMKEAHPYEEATYDVFVNHGAEEHDFLGLVGDLPREMTREELAGWIREKLGVTPRYNPGGPKRFSRLALCGGAGGEYVEKASRLGADAYLTGELRHHQFIEAQRLGIVAFDAGHYPTEVVCLPLLAEQLGESCPELELSIAESYGGQIIG